MSIGHTLPCSIVYCLSDNTLTFPCYRFSLLMTVITDIHAYLPTPPTFICNISVEMIAKSMMILFSPSNENNPQITFVGVDVIWRQLCPSVLVRVFIFYFFIHE